MDGEVLVATSSVKRITKDEDGGAVVTDADDVSYFARLDFDHLRKLLMMGT